MHNLFFNLLMIIPTLQKVIIYNYHSVMFLKYYFTYDTCRNKR